MSISRRRAGILSVIVVVAAMMGALAVPSELPPRLAAIGPALVPTLVAHEARRPGAPSLGAEVPVDNLIATTFGPPLKQASVPGASFQTLSSTSLSFDSQTLASTSAPQTVTLTNTGIDSLSIHPDLVVSSDFVLVEPTTCGGGLAVPAGGSCTVTVSFAPTTVGVRTGTLLIGTDSSATFVVSLTGIGVGVGPLGTLSSTNLSFGIQPLSTTSADQWVILTNTGTAPLHITSIGGALSESFHLAGRKDCGPERPLAVGGSCPIFVNFSPNEPWLRTGTLVITSDAVNSPHVIDLTGSGVPAEDVFFSDNFEADVAGWSSDAPWSVTAEAAHSGSRAWSDSPGGAYGANMNTSIRSPVINLTNATSAQLVFWHRRQFAGTGRGNVWVNTAGGSTYSLVGTYTGADPSWSQATIDLSAFAGTPWLRVVFQVQSDATQTGDGWYIDDVVVANVAPAPFGKIFPSDGATGLPIGSALRLEWQASGGATNYEYCYDTVNNNRCDTSWVDAGEWNATGVSGLAAGATYFWQVRARLMGTTEADTGAWWSFTTNGDVPPPTVTGMVPAGGATGVSTAAAVTAETTPPTVWKVRPSSGETLVSPRATVTAHFTEPIDAATLTTTAFVLSGPGGATVPATVSYDAVGRVGQLTPSAALAMATTYTATISTAVTDVAGNALTGPVIWSFTTASPTTVGLTTIGSLLDSGDRHYLNGSKVTTTAAGQVSSMSVYVGAIDSVVANRQYQLAIYRDHAGRPGTFVAASASGTLVANAWNTVAISAPLLASTNYWLMFNTNGRTASVNNMRYNTGAAGQGAYSTASVPFGAWPATFPATTTTNFVFSLYATLESNTLGLTAIGGSLDSGNSNSLHGSRVTATVSGQVSSMSVYVGAVDALVANRQFQLAIYGDDAGAPGLLLASSATGTLVANAWNTLPISALLPGGRDYWLMFNTNGRTASVNNMYYTSGTNGRGARSLGPEPFGTWPPSFVPTGTTFVYSLFATLAPDTTRPTVAHVTPVDGATGVSRAAAVTVQFGEPIKVTTLTTGPSGTFVLRDPANVVVPATVDYTGGSFTGTLTPSGALTPSTTYTATISTGVRDLAGNALASPVVWSFTTAAAAGPPAFGKQGPSNGSTGAIIRPYLGLTWQASAGATGYEYCIDTVDNNACDASWGTATGGLGVAVSGLTAGTTYFWQVRARNAAGTTEANAGTWWSVTTNTDVTPPTVTSVIPSDGATGVSPTIVVTAAFSEIIDTDVFAAGGAFVLSNSAGPVPVTVVYNTGALFATLTPVAPLAGSTTYTATVSRLRDMAGNQLASPVVWSFTTGPTDTIPPSVWKVRPSSGETLVSPRATVSAHFTDEIDGATLTTTAFVLSGPGGTTVPATVSYDAVARVGQLTPSAALAVATTYTATISTAVTDVAGNPLPEPVVWSFTTAPPSTVGLTTVGSLLDSGDSHYLNGSKITTTAAGQVSSMSVYVGAIDSVVANRQYQLAIYRDHAGRPGTFVAASASGTLVANAWNTVAVSAPLLASTNYWLMFNTNGRTSAVNNMRYNTGAAGQGAYSTASVPFGAWPATFPAATATNFVFSLYATLESNTLGLTTIGTSLDSGNSNSLHGSRVTATVSGQVSSMSVYVGAVDALVANRQFQFAIYGDDAGGPGTRVASSASGTLVANAWNTLPISALLSGGTDYWLMFNTNGRTASVNNMYYTSGTIAQGTHGVGPTPFGTWPLFFSSGGTTFRYSLFATVEPDTTRPTAAVVTPVDGATGVSTAHTVTVRFSEPIKVPTLTTGPSGTFVLRDPAGVVVPASVDYTASSFTATLTPSGALAPSTTYTATISTDVQDLAGNALADPVVWSFTTAAAGPPAFGKQGPSNGSTGAIIRPYLGLTWQASAGATSYEYCIDTVDNNACDASWVTATGGFGVAVSGLTAGTTYFWQVRARNAAGTTEANGGTWWSVTTNTDVTPPTVTSVIPLHGATGVSPTIVVTAAFSEVIDTDVFAAGGAFVLSNSAGPVPVTVVYNTGALFATLTPVAPLAGSTTYTATVNRLRDMAGNELASPVVWSFTTAPAPTVGSTAIGSALDSSDSNYLNGSKVTTTAGGQVSSMSVYVGAIDSVVANRQYQLAIYRDNAGRPGTLVAASATGTLLPNAWNTLAVSTPLLASTNYWLMFNTNGRTGAVNNMRYDTGAAGQGAYSTASVPFGTWPAAFPAATSTNFVFSLFATFGP